MSSRFSRQLARLPSPAAPPREHAMAGLRERLARALGRHFVPPPVGPPPPAFGDALPFARIDTPQGPLWRRRLSQRRDARVGRVALAFEQVDGAMLAALSLTPAIAAIDPTRALCIDAETTGLGGGTGNYAFLVGMCHHDGVGWTLEQILLSDPDEEPAMLAYVRKRIAGCDMLVSFNGKSFDLPLLRARYTMCRQPLPPERPHVDLLHLARRIHARRSFDKTLSTLEREVLGFARGPDVAGEEVARRYLSYLRLRDPRALDALHVHNAHDVLSLVALMAVYGRPLAWLEPQDIAAAARAAWRAGDDARARQLADVAVERRAGAEAHRIRAEISRAHGRLDAAAADYEALLRQRDDPDARLELAKLYEHRLRAPARALALAERGTGEPPDAEAKRLERLRRKLSVTVLASPGRLG